MGIKLSLTLIEIQLKLALFSCSSIEYTEKLLTSTLFLKQKKVMEAFNPVTQYGQLLLALTMTDKG